MFFKKLTEPPAIIIAAIIAAIATIVAVFLTPLAQKWATEQLSNPDTKILKIEELPVSIYVYSGTGGWAGLGLSYLNSAPHYNFSYYVPSDQSGYAGLAFRFNGGQNLSKYQRIEFTTKFDDKESEHTIDFYLRDISGQKKHIRLTEIGGSDNKESQLLSNFSGVNLNAVEEITFNTDNTFVSGGHQVTISNIQFVP